MGKRQKTSKTTRKNIEKEPIIEQEEEEEEEMVNVQGEDENEDKLTLDVLDAISDDEEDDGDNEDEEWNAEALALRQAIAEGAFDKINLSKKVKDQVVVDEDDIEEVEADEDDDEGSDKEEEEEAEEKGNKQNNQSETNSKALKTVTLELTTKKARLSWPERFDITPATPLPFGKKDEEGNIVQIHDDLKREVVFYNLALEAVHAARKNCDDVKIPFSRPEDFFAEMVKTDDHMAKVKDRLIFENKKIDSFEQRKSNREQKLRAKEAHAHRLSEKAKAKKRHMQDVEDWAKSAASNRIGNKMVRDDDEEYLNRMNNNSGPNKKRMAMNKKYGYGGKRGRFKQNDKKSINDMSGFNPKGGNFAGGKKTGVTKRKGKRARDAAKSKR